MLEAKIFQKEPVFNGMECCFCIQLDKGGFIDFEVNLIVSLWVTFII